MNKISISHEKGDAHLSRRSTTDHNDKAVGPQDYHGIDTRVRSMGADEVYEKKIAIMNEALIDLGMGSFQWKVFAMTGFGWFVDNVSFLSSLFALQQDDDKSMLLTIKQKALDASHHNHHTPRTHRIRRPKNRLPQRRQIRRSRRQLQRVADFIGRRLAFNITLLISAVAGLVGAGSPNFAAIATFCACIGLGTGGNQPVDSAIFFGVCAGDASVSFDDAVFVLVVGAGCCCAYWVVCFFFCLGEWIRGSRKG